MTNKEKQDALVAFLTEHNMQAVCIINYEDSIGNVSTLDGITLRNLKHVAAALCREGVELREMWKKELARLSGE